MRKRILSLLVILSLLAAAVCVPVSANEIQVQEVVYDFDLTETELRVGGKRTRGMGLTYEPVRKEMDEFYLNGGIDWKYVYDNIDYLATSENSAKNTFYFGNSEDYKWDGLRIGACVIEGEKKIYPAGYWMAITIRVPEDGVYMLSLDYQTRADGTTAGEIYLLEGLYPDHMTVERTLDESLRLGVLDFFKETWDIESAYADIGEVELTEGEHTVVFRAAEPDGNGVSAYMYLSRLILSNKPLQEQADKVDALIRAIDVKDSGTVSAAREAYDSLTQGARSYVQQLSVLLQAEATSGEKDGGGLWYAIAAAAVVVAGGIGAAVAIRKKKAK